ncbi:hypothetical protein H0H93_009558 [Arthromyces matolae]|nr:hypothetical protein H0H93_009558 [Arthromyces matolae]
MATSNDKNPIQPGPDDDLEDLDDVLEQFNQPKASSRPSQPASTTSPVPAAPAASGSGAAVESDISDDFAKELAEGMASLMREISGEASGEKGNLADTMTEDQQRMMKAAWEAMLIEELGEPGVESKSDENGHGSFQSSIKKTMDKLKESEDDARTSTSKSATGAGLEEGFEELLKKFSGADGNNDEDMQGLLESMMGSLMSKEVLYEPLKELSESFPPYVQNPPTPLSPEDKKRYELQIVCIQKILAEFDKPTYNDEDPTSRSTITNLMSEMQEHGSPPAELMGPLPSGLDLDGMGGLGADGKMPDDCVIA